MAILQSLCSLALGQLVEGACQAAGLGAGVPYIHSVVKFLNQHLTDHSQRLDKALRTSSDRAWKVLEISLAGTSWWERCQGMMASGEEKAFRESMQAFLAALPRSSPTELGPEFQQQCLSQLRAARKAGLLSAGKLDPADLAQRTGSFARFRDPNERIEAEWGTVERMADELGQAGYPTLARFLTLRPGPTEPLLAMASRYFFRREIENDPALFQGLAWARLERLQDTQEQGFAALTSILDERGEHLEKLLDNVGGVVAETHAAVLDLRGEIQGQKEQIRDLGQSVLQLLESYRLQSRGLHSSDSLSIRSGAERQLVKELVARYRALPADQQHQLPALLNALGKLQVVAGEFDGAQKDFQQAARLAPTRQAEAEAHANAYHAALEQRDWTVALQELRQAIDCDPTRYTPFPFDKYEPTRILGGGGFGVAFLCQHRYMDTQVVVKALHVEELDRDVAKVFQEAQLLRQLDHPSIIRLWDCGFADEAAHARPYLVMDYFDGLTLEEQVRQNGPLQDPEELLPLASAVAEGLQAAHSRSILHRDVKPANLLVRREGNRWQVKLIDFGLALQRGALQSTARNAAHDTANGSSVAGTVDYAAPEQMGRLKGVSVGPYSDVYGFGKTCCYALFGVAQPLPRHWESLPPALAQLLGDCLEESPERRPATFTKILLELRHLPAHLPILPVQPAVELVEQVSRKEKFAVSAIPVVEAAPRDVIPVRSSHSGRGPALAAPEAPKSRATPETPRRQNAVESPRIVPQTKPAIPRSGSKYILWGLLIAGVCGIGFVMLLSLAAVPLMIQGAHPSGSSLGESQQTSNQPVVVGNWQANWNGRVEMIALYANGNFEKFLTAYPADVARGTYTFSNGTLVLTSVRAGTEQINLVTVSDKEMSATYSQGRTYAIGTASHWIRQF